MNDCFAWSVLGAAIGFAISPLILLSLDWIADCYEAWRSDRIRKQIKRELGL